ncbi:MAG TPA: TIM barrel protein, partial [Chloroflexota bacterium]
DALRLVREVDEAPIQLLVDVWHLERERETSDVVLDAGAALRHVHVAQGDARTFPLELDERLDRFFRHLSTIRYDGRVSVEGFTADFTRDARRALNLLRGLAGRS